MRQRGNGYEHNDSLGGLFAVMQHVRVGLQPRHPEDPLQPSLHQILPLVLMLPVMRAPRAAR